MFFVAPRKRQPLVVEVPLRDASVERLSRFLSEKVRVSPADGRAYAFSFERGHSFLVDQIVRRLASPPGKELEAVVAM